MSEITLSQKFLRFVKETKFIWKIPSKLKLVEEAVGEIDKLQEFDEETKAEAIKFIRQGSAQEIIDEYRGIQ